MQRTRYPDARPGLPPLVFDDEQERQRVLASLSEARACAEASLSIPEHDTTTQAQLAKLKVEQDMALRAPSLEAVARFMVAVTAFAQGSH